MTEEIDKDTLEALKKGAAWYEHHRKAVDSLCRPMHESRIVGRMKPAGSELHHPELWDDFNWMWFFREANKWLP